MYVRNQLIEKKRPLSLAELRAQLPKLGDIRMECPTIDETTNSRGTTFATKPQRCVVVDVRPENLWYTVEFENGIRESYKVPALRSGGDSNE
jgi:hypothetical protein